MIKKLFTLVILLNLLTGCSVLLALRDNRNDFWGIRPGTIRPVVEAKLGDPVNVIHGPDDQTIMMYEYTRFYPSATRALVHGGLDFLTGFAWEFIGTPIEIWGMPSYHLMLVTYNKDNVATKIE